MLLAALALAVVLASAGSLYAGHLHIVESPLEIMISFGKKCSLFSFRYPFGAHRFGAVVLFFIATTNRVLPRLPAVVLLTIRWLTTCFVVSSYYVSNLVSISKSAILLLLPILLIHFLAL
jgi:hypothetical protein